MGIAPLCGLFLDTSSTSWLSCKLVMSAYLDRRNVGRCGRDISPIRDRTDRKARTRVLECLARLLRGSDIGKSVVRRKSFATSLLLLESLWAHQSWLLLVALLLVCEELILPQAASLVRQVSKLREVLERIFEAAG